MRVSLIYLLLYSLRSQLSKYYHGHSLKRLSYNRYSRVFAFFLSVMPLDQTACRGGTRTAATSKMERFVITVNGFYYPKALHFGCCSSPRSASDVYARTDVFQLTKF